MDAPNILAWVSTLYLIFGILIKSMYTKTGIIKKVMAFNVYYTLFISEYK